MTYIFINQNSVNNPPLEGGSKSEAIRGGVNFKKLNLATPTRSC